MTISITDRSGLVTDELRQLAERRLLFALSRFDKRIIRVNLVICDENGPRGGIDKACQIKITLRRAADVIVRHRDVDMARCISRMAERAGRAVSRAIERTQSFARIRPMSYDTSAESTVR